MALLFTSCKKELSGEYTNGSAFKIIPKIILPTTTNPFSLRNI